MKQAALLLILASSLAGCSTLNKYGVGGKPALMCDYASGQAHIDDRLIGTPDAQAKLSVVRRFADVDPMCADLVKFRAGMELYRAMREHEAAELLRQIEKAAEPGL